MKAKDRAEKRADAQDKSKTKSGRDKKTRENLSKYENPKDTEYDEAQENRDYYRQELGEDPEDGCFFSLVVDLFWSAGE